MWIRHNKISKSAANRPGKMKGFLTGIRSPRTSRAHVREGSSMLKSALLIGAEHMVWCRCGSRTARRRRANGPDDVRGEYQRRSGLHRHHYQEVKKSIKGNGGQRLAGGFNKAKLVDGTGAVGNRYVIVSWPNAAAFKKAQSDGLARPLLTNTATAHGRLWCKASRRSRLGVKAAGCARPAVFAAPWKSIRNALGWR